MNARDKLYEAMAGGWSLTHAEAASLYRVVDDVLGVHAHELAEQQREALERGPGADWDYATGHRLADLIDPLAGASSVRPDEEPTP